MDYKRKTRRFLAYALLVDLLLLIVTMVAIRRLGILFDLRRAARYDALTQIYNRRGFEEAMEKEQRRRPKQPFALAILDVDDFKFFNDYYGHQTGDAVLKQLAWSLKEAAGESGLVCRSGGDEFLLALLGQTAPEAERVFKKIVDAPHELDHNGHHIVYSFTWSRQRTWSASVPGRKILSKRRTWGRSASCATMSSPKTGRASWSWPASAWSRTATMAC